MNIVLFFVMIGGLIVFVQSKSGIIAFIGMLVVFGGLFTLMAVSTIH